MPNRPAAPAPISTPAASITYHSGWTSSATGTAAASGTATTGPASAEKTYHASSPETPTTR